MASPMKFAAFGVITAFGIYQLKQYMNGPMCKSNARLDGKVAVITGANTGIGKESAIDFVQRGGRVVMACRSMDRCNSAARDILDVTKASSDKVVTRHLDLSSFASIRQFAKEFKQEESRLDILMNNGGVMWPPYTLSEDGYELTFAVNHLGHFLLTQLLAQTLVDSAPSRVITVSSRAHIRATFNTDIIHSSQQNYSSTASYSFSKLSNVLFSKYLGELLKGTGVTTYSVHPGVIRTELARHVTFLNGPVAKSIFYYITWPFFKEPLYGAQTQICCAADPNLTTSTAMYYRDCAETEPSDEAKNDANARWLWEASIRMTKLTREEMHPRLR